MRLIDADKMCADLATVDPYYERMIEWCITVTKAQPTIDAVEVVRCKDCKYEQQCRKAIEHITYQPTTVTVGYNAVDYCSYGKRKEQME